MKKKILVIGGNSDIAFHTISNFLNIAEEIIFLSKNLDDLSLKINKLEKVNKNIKFKKFYFDILNLNESLKILSEYNNFNIIIFSVGYLENPEHNIDKLIDVNYKNILILSEWIIQKLQKNRGYYLFLHQLLQIEVNQKIIFTHLQNQVYLIILKD